MIRPSPNRGDRDPTPLGGYCGPCSGCVSVARSRHRPMSRVAVVLNPESNPGLSDRRRRRTTVKIGSTRPGFRPRSLKSEASKLSQIDDLSELGSNPGRPNQRFSTTQKFTIGSNARAVVRTYACWISSSGSTTKPPRRGLSGSM